MNVFFGKSPVVFRKKGLRDINFSGSQAENRRKDRVEFAQSSHEIALKLGIMIIGSFDTV